MTTLASLATTALLMFAALMFVPSPADAARPDQGVGTALVCARVNHHRIICAESGGRPYRPHR